MRRLAVVFAVLLAVAPVTSHGTQGRASGVCVYKKPPPKLSKAEAFLRETIAKREGWTLPHGRSYVRRVNANEANRRRGREVLDIPLTAREAAYFARRERLNEGPAGRRLYRYLRRHADVFGAMSIEDDFPRPYLQLRVKQDLEMHRAAIRRIFPRRFKLKLVRFSKPELTRIHDSIDDDALEREGIHLIASAQSADGVEAYVATTREDAQAVVDRLYGPGVKVVVYGPTPAPLECRTPETYEVEPDGRTLRVRFGDSGSITPKEVEVVESAGEVRLGVVVESPYSQNDDLRPYTLKVTLAAPLGDRAVKSIETGRRIRRG